MVNATPAPKVKHPHYLFVPYAYAIVLAALAVVQLIGVGGFDFAHIKYQTPGVPGVIMLIAGLEIFSLPFLLRLSLSPLARFCSALFALLTPFFILTNMIYLLNGTIGPNDWYQIVAAVVLIVAAIKSFMVLNGPQALSFSKK